MIYDEWLSRTSFVLDSKNDTVRTFDVALHLFIALFRGREYGVHIFVSPQLLSSLSSPTLLIRHSRQPLTPQFPPHHSSQPSCRPYRLRYADAQRQIAAARSPAPSWRVCLAGAPARLSRRLRAGLRRSRGAGGGGSPSPTQDRMPAGAHAAAGVRGPRASMGCTAVAPPLHRHVAPPMYAPPPLSAPARPEGASSARRP